MTQLILHRDLSFCTVDGHLVFLDIQRDRYFRLNRNLESDLITYLGGGNAPDGGIRTLIEQKILITGSADPDDATQPLAKSPTRSAMEAPPSSKRASVSQLIDILTIVYSTQRQLKTHGLKNVLGELASLRRKRSRRSATRHHSAPRVLELAAAFRSARLYVPTDTCCLLDSIAMVKFLAKRGLSADLVFGVTGDPFSAHCWAQYGTTILNDALGHAQAFTPIRTI